MKRNLSHRRNDNFRGIRAQGMTEYILVVVLVAIGCISAVTVFGQKVARLFKGATKALDTGVVQIEKSDADSLKTNFTLGDFGGDAGGAAGSIADGLAGGR